jgi:hypothetical protein
MAADGTRHAGEVAGLAALGLVVTCGLPVLLSVGAGYRYRRPRFA